MKVLWICNVVLADYAAEFGIPVNSAGGWMSSMLELLETRFDGEIMLVFPIYDDARRKDGIANGHRYYTFDGKIDREPYSEREHKRFEEIINQCNPDIIHVWGTEFNHSRAVIEVAKNRGLIDHTVIDIQGLTTAMRIHYLLGIPSDYLMPHGYERGMSILEDYDTYEQKEINERIIFSHVRYVTGRTDWDYTVSHNMLTNGTYYKNHRTLRNGFYENSGTWSIDECERHSIYLSNGAYPAKGLHLFIPAIHMIKTQYPDTKVYVGGYDPTIPDSTGMVKEYGEYISKLINKYELKDTVFFCGMISEEEVIMHLKKANAFVATSTVDNSCNSLCEAMMIGTPSIASYVGGMPELLNHGESGFLYQVDAYYMAAEYVKRIFSNDTLANGISQVAVKVARDRHDKKGIISNFLNLYQMINNQSGR